MRKVPTQSIEKRGRETRETSRQDFFQRPQRQREGERKAGNVKDPEKEKNEMGAGRRGVRNGGRKGEEILNILLGFVSKKIPSKLQAAPRYKLFSLHTTHIA